MTGCLWLRTGADATEFRPERWLDEECVSELTTLMSMCPSLLD
jgi:hypothetical protein